MLKIADLAAALQTLYGPAAERLARQTRFCRRERTLTGPVFARTLVFGRLARPVAARAADASLPVTPQALHARVTPAAAEFLAARPETIPLLRRFRGVSAEDLTDLGPAGQALVRYERGGGGLDALSVPDHSRREVPASAELPSSPAGALRLADRGFFDAATLNRLSDSGVHWVTRVPTGAKVAVGPDCAFVPLAEWLASIGGDAADVPARVGAGSPVAGRLTARRCPAAVAARRRRSLEATARRKRRPVSAAQWTVCEWTVYLTDLPKGEFAIQDLEVLCRCRWQVELLFKRFKSLGGVGSSRGTRPARQQVEVLAKLLAAVVAEWGALLGGGPLAVRSPEERGRRVRAMALRLTGGIGRVVTLSGVLRELAEASGRLTPRRRRGSPSTRQLLFRPRLIA